MKVRSSIRRPRRVVHSEALEPRCLMSSGLAPRTIAGATIDATITAGLSPLDVSGTYTFLGASDTTYSIVDAGGGASDGAGNYSYSRLFPSPGNTGVIHYTDGTTGLTYNDVLTFLTANAGSYVITPAAPGGAGSQTGSFAFAAGPPVATADPAVSMVTTPTASFVGGANGNVTVNVANVGTLNANAYVTLNLFLSPDGTVANGTPVTSLSRKISLGIQPDGDSARNVNITIPFTYPTIVTGNYFWIVTLSPSLGLGDADQSNDEAVSQLPVTVSTPYIDLATTDVTVKNLPAVGVVTATKQQAIVTVLNDGNVRIAGTVHFSLYTTDVVGGVDTPIIPKSVPVQINMAPGKQIEVSVKFIGPNLTVSTEQYIVAVLSTNGVVTETNTINGVDANNTVHSVDPVLFTPPSVAMTAALLGTLPTSVVGGSNGTTTLQATNIGNVPFNALLTVTLYISPAPALVAGNVQVLFGGKNKMIAPGKSISFPLQFTYPSTLANGVYYLLAQLTSTTTPVAGAVPPLSVSVPPSNVAVNSTPVNISQPIVSLEPEFGTLPGTVFAAGQTVTLPLDLLNSGNVIGKGKYTVQLLASTTGDPTDPTAVPLSVVFKNTLSLKPNAMSTVKLKFTMPSGSLVSGTPYFFIARLDASGIPDITDANPTAVSTQTFTVS